MTASHAPAVTPGHRKVQTQRAPGTDLSWILRLLRVSTSTELVAARGGGTCTEFLHGREKSSGHRADNTTGAGMEGEAGAGPLSFHRLGNGKSRGHQAGVTPRRGDGRSDGNCARLS